jgi:hypothetical protein
MNMADGNLKEDIGQEYQPSGESRESERKCLSTAIVDMQAEIDRAIVVSSEPNIYTWLKTQGQKVVDSYCQWQLNGHGLMGQSFEHYVYSDLLFHKIEAIVESNYERVFRALRELYPDLDQTAEADKSNLSYQLASYLWGLHIRDRQLVQLEQTEKKPEENGFTHQEIQGISIYRKLIEEIKSANPAFIDHLCQLEQARAEGALLTDQNPLQAFLYFHFWHQGVSSKAEELLGSQEYGEWQSTFNSESYKRALLFIANGFKGLPVLHNKPFEDYVYEIKYLDSLEAAISRNPELAKGLFGPKITRSGILIPLEEKEKKLRYAEGKGFDAIKAADPAQRLTQREVEQVRTYRKFKDDLKAADPDYKTEVENLERRHSNRLLCTDNKLEALELLAQYYEPTASRKKQMTEKTAEDDLDRILESIGGEILLLQGGSPKEIGQMRQTAKAQGSKLKDLLFEKLKGDSGAENLVQIIEANTPIFFHNHTRLIEMLGGELYRLHGGDPEGLKRETEANGRNYTNALFEKLRGNLPVKNLQQIVEQYITKYLKDHKVLSSQVRQLLKQTGDDLDPLYSDEREISSALLRTGLMVSALNEFFDMSQTDLMQFKVTIGQTQESIDFRNAIYKALGLDLGYTAESVLELIKGLREKTQETDGLNAQNRALEQRARNLVSENFNLQSQLQETSAEARSYEAQLRKSRAEVSEIDETLQKKTAESAYFASQLEETKDRTNSLAGELGQKTAELEKTAGQLRQNMEETERLKRELREERERIRRYEAVVERLARAGESKGWVKNG